MTWSSNASDFTTRSTDYSKHQSLNNCATKSSGGRAMSDAIVNRPIGQPANTPEEQGGPVARPDAGMLRHLVRQIEPALVAHHREERTAMMRQAAAQLAWQ